MVNMISRIFLFLMVVSLFGCAGSKETSCDYRLSTWEEKEKGGGSEAYSNTIAYLFNTDTTTCFIPSYESAYRGEMRLRNGGVKHYSRLSKYDEASVGILFDALDAGTRVIVVCDTINQIYFYRQTAILPGAKQVSVRLIFTPYKFETNRDTTVVVNQWIQKM